MIKAVIFDMDGVLIDSQPLHYDADLSELKKLGINAEYKDVVKYAGTITEERFKLYKRDFSLDFDVNKAAAEREEIMKNIFSNSDVGSIAGVKELLKDLKYNGILTAVASSSNYELIYTVVDKLNIREYFDVILSGNDMKRGKPAPDIFIAAAEKLNMKACECVVIEDSANGVQAAVSAGMKVVGYINETSGKQDLSKATVIIDDFNKINGNFIIAL